MNEKDTLRLIQRLTKENPEIIIATDQNIGSLPPEIGGFKMIYHLNLNNTSLKLIPPEIGQLQNLHSLLIQNNELGTLPLEIGKLTELQQINVAHNRLKVLPKEIGNLQKLRILSAQNNQLTSLPLEITNIKSLQELDLRGNPLPIPPEILDKVKEPAKILNYYIEQMRGPRRPINEVKVLIVGQGSVGKTSLVQQILYGRFDPYENKTEGISINEWQVDARQVADSGGLPSSDKDQDESIKLNIWDFGGQEIMHATHQFFLTKRSLYLLVLDARLTQEENRVEYWLKIIQSFGGESPVIIVGNKTDQHPLDIDRTGLQKKYSNIVGIVETSAYTGAGIRAVKSEIVKQVDALPHVRDLLPKSWFTVKSKLEELGKKKNFITSDEYVALCGKNDVRDQISQRTLIGFLHDLGIVLHFQDDSRLEALGILNPQWVTNGVYKILNSHELFQDLGNLTPASLNKILDLPEYPKDKRLFIVDMMKKFELCYDIDAQPTFLIPDLLSKNEPYTGEWNGALAFQYHYSVLPNSIITRFIVRMNTFIYKTVWRSGVVLQRAGNTALVKAESEEHRICIWVNGEKDTRRDFLSVIRAEFESIHKTIIKIDAKELVPHPTYPDAIFDYLELLQFERDGIREFPRSIIGKSILINVQELLNGVSAPENRQGLITIKRKPLLLELLYFILVKIPHFVGQIILDVFGRSKVARATRITIGYLAIILVALILRGVLGLDTFIQIWRFFVPEPK
jgi:internalin A